LLIVFAELRKTCATRKIDIRGALDDAVKVIAPTCTGDALVQQLVKRERRILDLWQTQDTPVQRGRADKQKEKEATEADTAREGDSGRANDVSTIDPPFSTPRNQTRAKKSNSLNNGANSAGAPSTSAHLKTENADDEEASPQTPSPAQYESDSDYTESPDKGKKKRIRGNVKQASKKSSTKKTRKQLIDSEDEQEDGLVETPTKKSAVKHLRRTPAKKNSATTLSIKAQPGTARKTLPKAETAVESAQPESDDEIEDKAYLGLKNAENAQIDVQDMNSQIKHSTSGSPGHMQSFREDSSGHDSFGSTPLSSNGFGGESFNGYSFGNDSFDNQSFDDNSFGGPLFGGNLDSFYQDQFVPFHMQGSATMPVLSGAMNSMLPGTMMANGMGNYAAMEMCVPIPALFWCC
jgi:hypothetical protein